EYCKTELDGLRIMIPAGQPKPTTVGLVTKFPVKGDFEITVGFEILQANRPTTGNGVGLELYLSTRNGDAIAFYRMNRVREGDGYHCSRIWTNAEGVRQNKAHPEKTESKAGQLRLTRTGTTVTFSVRDDAGNDFRDIHDVKYVADDVAGVYLRAF